MELKPHEFIVKIRKELGLSQIDLAKALNSSQPQISYAEKGANEQLLRRIAYYLIKTYGKETSYELYDIFPNERPVGATDEIKQELKELRKAIESLKEKIDSIK